jgi:hypothetical protein
MKKVFVSLLCYRVQVLHSVHRIVHMHRDFLIVRFVRPWLSRVRLRAGSSIASLDRGSRGIYQCVDLYC